MITTREKRFSEEVSALIAAVQPVYSHLFGSLTNKLTSVEKEVMWQAITDSVSCVRAEVVRSKDKIKDKWIFLKSEAKSKYDEYKRAAEKTGGGEAPHDLAEKYLQIMNMVPAVSFKGLIGRER